MTLRSRDWITCDSLSVCPVTMTLHLFVAFYFIFLVSNHLQNIVIFISFTFYYFPNI